MVGAEGRNFAFWGPLLLRNEPSEAIFCTERNKKLLVKVAKLKLSMVT